MGNINDVLSVINRKLDSDGYCVLNNAQYKGLTKGIPTVLSVTIAPNGNVQFVEQFGRRESDQFIPVAVVTWSPIAPEGAIQERWISSTSQIGADGEPGSTLNSRMSIQTYFSQLKP